MPIDKGGLEQRLKRLERKLQPHQRLVALVDTPDNRALVATDPRYAHAIVVWLLEAEAAL